MPGGGLIEQMVDPSSLGQEVLGPVRLETLGMVDTSSSAFFARPPSEPILVDSLVECSLHRTEALLESSRWREEGDILARHLGFTVSDKQGGYEAVAGFVQVNTDGEVG